MLLEQLSFALDKENKRCYDIYKAQGLNDIEIQQKIKENLEIKNIIKDAPNTWDGGYVVFGAVGNGDMFVLLMSAPFTYNNAILLHVVTISGRKYYIILMNLLFIQLRYL